MIATAALVLALQTDPTASPVPSPVAATPAASPAAGTPAATPAAAPQPPPAIPTAGPSAPLPGSPLPVPTSTTSPSPYTYQFVPRQPDHVEPGTPQIFAVYLNSKQLHSQGPIAIKVSTSPDVVKIVSRSGGHEGIVPMIAPGDFEATGKLPKIPFIARGMTVNLNFIATGSNGKTTSVRVPVQIL